MTQKFLLSILVLSCLFVTVSSDCPVSACPAEAVEWKSVCYFFKSPASAFMNGESTCNKLGGHLTSIHEGFTNSFIARKFCFLRSGAWRLWTFKASNLIITLIPSFQNKLPSLSIPQYPLTSGSVEPTWSPLGPGHGQMEPNSISMSVGIIVSRTNLIVLPRTCQLEFGICRIASKSKTLFVVLNYLSKLFKSW